MDAGAVAVAVEACGEAVEVEVEVEAEVAGGFGKERVVIASFRVAKSASCGMTSVLQYMMVGE